MWYKSSFFLYVFGIIITGLSTILFKLYFQPSPIQIHPNINTQTHSLIKPVSQIPSVSTLYTIHISGAVQTPGVYELDSNQRLVDAIKKAGGALEKADLNSINLAQKLSDGLKFTISE